MCVFPCGESVSRVLSFVLTIEKASNRAPHNKGASIPDTDALGPAGESLSTWHKKRGIDPSSQVRVVRLVHMRYQHPDLEKLIEFLQDFGMEIAHRIEDRVWLRGYGVDQYVYYAQAGPKRFLGGTFEVEEYKDLVKASNMPGADSIQTLNDAPGGGFLVTAFDAEEQPINFIFGQELRKQITELPEPLIVNFETRKPRIRKFQRFQPGPAGVHKVSDSCSLRQLPRLMFLTKMLSSLATMGFV